MNYVTQQIKIRQFPVKSKYAISTLVVAIVTRVDGIASVGSFTGAPQTNFSRTAQTARRAHDLVCIVLYWKDY